MNHKHGQTIAKAQLEINRLDSKNTTKAGVTAIPATSTDTRDNRINTDNTIIGTPTKCVAILRGSR
ncbi:hypothetical protein BMETH_1744_0 [methanotrophic bacterial endosymbiont of Bathymodiolus sp.]|nr:hypothetical protein BMETH_1744_0 [methanotrophic bacterial endosymbiont of Bathymodiolus sp.]